jgi:phosphate acetyltransferase
MDHVLKKTRRVTLFRPIITTNSPQEKDKNIELLLEHFKLDQTYEEAFAFHRKDAQKLISLGKTDELLDQVIGQYKELEKKSDFILCEGTDFLSEGSAFEFGVNVQIAKNLGSSVLIIGRGDLGRSVEDILSPIQLAIENFHEQDYEVLGAIVNRADMGISYELLKAMEKQLPADNLLLSIIPSNELLKSPTVKEIAQQLHAEVLYGEDLLDNQVFRYSVAAMQLPNFLDAITDHCLVITPGDRGEIVLGTLEAHLSKNYPKIAGVVLTAGLKPSSSILKLLDGLPQSIPILSVKDNTFQAATRIDQINTYITPDNKAKIHESLHLFEQYVDLRKLEEKTSAVIARGMTPRMFQYMLTQKAKSDKKHIVLPEAEDERILKAADILLKQDIVRITLLGEPEEIYKKINRLGLDLDNADLQIIQPQESPQFEEYAATFQELRKKKGVNMDMARDAMSDRAYFGTMMVYQGDADGMVSGAIHTTQHTIRPALQFVKTKPGFSIVSSVFFMCLDDRVLVYGDCAINPNPNAQELAEIAISSAQTAAAFGIEPKVAMLSYSSGQSGKGADVDVVREATERVKEKQPDLKVEGPIQYDAAVDPEVGAKKIPGSEVAGKASVLIFPDLNTGNNTYKAVQRETGAVAIGPVLQGLNRPVNDLSRGCTITDIVNTVIITAIQAQDS